MPRNRLPTPPGEILIAEFLKPLGLSQTTLAAHLGGSWTQTKISKIIHNRRPMKAAIALDLADVFKTSPEFWLNLQMRHGLWIAMQNRRSFPMLPQLKGT